MPDDTNHPPIPVGVGVRIVPAGIVWRARHRFLRAALILSPVAPDRRNIGRTVDLRQWPELIERDLAGADIGNFAEIGGSPVAVIVAPVDREHPAPGANGGAARRVPAIRAMYHDRRALPGGSPPDIASWKSRRAADVTAIGMLWRKLLAPADKPEDKTKEWEALARVIKPGGTKLLEELKVPANPPAGPPDASGVSGMQPGGTAAETVAVSPMGRAAAALVLSTERARCLIERLKSSRSAGAAAPRPVNLAYEPFEPLDWGRGWPSWAGPVPSLVRHASAEGTGAPAGPQALQERLLAADVAAAAEQARSAAAGKASPRDPSPAASIIERAATRRIDEISRAVDDAVDRHGSATVHGTPPPEQPGRCPQLPIDEQARARLLGIQSQPSLARLFNLVVDVLIPIEEVEAVVLSSQAVATREGIANRVRFAFLAGVIDALGAERRVWTAAKARLSDEGGPDVFACTQDEIKAALEATKPEDYRNALIGGAIELVDGYLPLAASETTACKADYRFDVTSIDLSQALDHRRTALSDPDAKGRQLLTLRTAGLALLDHGRRRAATGALLRSLSRTAPDAVEIVDATDLTAGYRLDVGVQQGGVIEWRDLCRRTIAFGDPSDVTQPVIRDTEFGRLLAQVIPLAADRAAYDGATLVLPARLQPEGKGQRAYVDETVANWLGAPLGIDPEADEIALREGCAPLRLSQTYSLAPPAGWTAGAAWQIPRLVLGAGYYMRMRAVLAGGIVRGGGPGLGDDVAPHLAIPNETAGPRRHLRHERIEAPLVSTPQPMLERPLDGVRDGLRETGTSVILRSRRQSDGTMAVDPPHARSVRVVVPPGVSATFADEHKQALSAVEAVIAFQDERVGSWMGPRDGMRDVDFDHARAGGFPVWTFDAGTAGALDDGVGFGQPFSPKANGDSVFRPRTVDRPRRLPYHPDPMAEYLVIQVRDEAGKPLADRPLVVPVRPRGVTAPDVRPVAIEFVAQPVSSKTTTSSKGDAVLGLEAEDGTMMHADAALSVAKRPALFTLDAAGRLLRGTPRAGVSVGVSRVEVRLPPGTVADVVIWCLPTATNLARHFDVVETAALLASYDPGSGEACKPGQDLARTIADRIGAGESEVRAALDREAKVRAGSVTTLGQRQLEGATIRAVSGFVHAMATAAGAPEIAASIVIRTVHAVDQPLSVPTGVLSVHRLSTATRTAVLERGEAMPPAPEPGEAGILIAGTVTFDPATTGFVEIVAEGESLVGGRFDDPDERKRSLDQVARGLWPIDPARNAPKDPRDVYGFSVAPDDSVTFEREQAVLLRIDSPAGIWPSSDLLELQRAAAKAEQAAKAGNVDRLALRATTPFVLADTRARRLSLTVRVGSRTANSFRNGASGRMLEAAKTVLTGTAQTVILPATKAPAQLVPLTVAPSARITPASRGPGSAVVVREPMLRVTWRRPGATSGANERLGLVLWPPEILSDRIGPDHDTVVRDYDGADYLAALQRRDIDMRGFSDADLGPGGVYVTRWGRDPIKSGPGPLGWLMPADAFADLGTAPIDSPSAPKAQRWDALACADAEVVYVPRATMPIPGGTPGADGTGTTMEVALLTYRPRFDADREVWYADVALSGLGVAAPFVRLGLVRYQPLAERVLRVSEPVVEWAQIMPGRRVVATASRTERGLVTVTVTGPGSFHAAAEPDGHDAARLSWWRQRPLMRMTVLRRGPDGVETPARLADPDGTIRNGKRHPWAERTFIPRTQAELDCYLTRFDADKPCPDPPPGIHLPLPDCAVLPNPDRQAAGSLCWTGTFRLATDPLDDAQVEHVVFVEEIDAMRPATYAQEPVDEGAADFPNDDQLVLSGPRFAARVEIGPHATEADNSAKRGRGAS
ncbi:hypothetical protein [Methylobacterium sp. AMS5]|uniref:hypothetical protein n=1 Tax=Methylobacterium sp. AMS5 TaxID=925818 RepID=UPI00074FA015|nr:hypothetical protein [Methylobacterium sp. AMS5]AMB44850.1 hypothetical protein Y590_08090 [Methylobacterium sp. AMS5]